jgi:hypothetical protein
MQVAGHDDDRRPGTNSADDIVSVLISKIEVRDHQIDLAILK